MNDLATLDDLPVSYVQSLSHHNLTALWPSLRAALPFDKPNRRTRPIIWRYKEVRPLLLEAGELTPIEKAERRVLALSNPGLGLENMQATPAIYIGLQLILPQETAPNHRHSPSAIRFVVEGEGGFTVVDGERMPMEPGDLILTPSGMWHEHGHAGTGPVVWMDALDLPTVFNLECSYGVEGEPQVVRNQPDSSQTRYRRSGLVPYKNVGKAKSNYPLLRFPWTEVRSALRDLASVTDMNEAVQLAYVNPETGQECLPILGFSAIMLRPGETLAPVRRSASCVFHVIEGDGEVEIDGTTMAWTKDDTIAAPTHAEIRVRNGSAKSPAFLFQVDDAPMQRKLGFYEEFH